MNIPPKEYILYSTREWKRKKIKLRALFHKCKSSYHPFSSTCKIQATASRSGDRCKSSISETRNKFWDGKYMGLIDQALSWAPNFRSGYWMFTQCHFTQTYIYAAKNKLMNFPYSIPFKNCMDIWIFLKYTSLQVKSIYIKLIIFLPRSIKEYIHTDKYVQLV